VWFQDIVLLGAILYYI